MHDDVFEFLEREQARTANRRVPGLDVLERAVREIDAEDDVQDVPVARLPPRRDRLGDCDRPLERELLPAPELLSELPPECRRQGLPPSTPPPGRSQYSRPGFSWRQSSTRFCHRTSTATRTRGPFVNALRPEAADATLRVRQLLHFDGVHAGNRQDHELRIRIPGSTTNAACRSVFSRLIFSSPR